MHSQQAHAPQRRPPAPSIMTRGPSWFSSLLIGIMRTVRSGAPVISPRAIVHQFAGLSIEPGSLTKKLDEELDTHSAVRCVLNSSLCRRAGPLGRNQPSSSSTTSSEDESLVPRIRSFFLAGAGGVAARWTRTRSFFREGAGGAGDISCCPGVACQVAGRAVALAATSTRPQATARLPPRAIVSHQSIPALGPGCSSLRGLSHRGTSREPVVSCRDESPARQQVVRCSISDRHSYRARDRLWGISCLRAGLLIYVGESAKQCRSCRGEKDAESETPT